MAIMKNKMMKILVVDDEETICNLLDEFLSQMDYQVKIATNGQEAIKKVEDEKPDIVLLDVKMPGITGIDVLGKIKNIDRNIGIIILSAFGDSGIIRDAMQLGADYYLEKPMKLEFLMQLLLAWQENHEFKFKIKIK